jgi:sugar O-acyltransferase (sialic acid O-acetyltransferase NeuD family)
MKRIAVVGAGGQARDTAWLIEQINAHAPTFEFVGFLVSDLGALTPHDSAVEGDESWLDDNDIDALALGIGSPSARHAVAARLEAKHPSIEWPQLIHPSAIVAHATNTIGRGVMISSYVVATGGCTIGDHVVLNPHVTVGHDSEIRRATVMNHAAGVSGTTRIGERVLIGTGARVLQGLRVGQGATVGAGAVVTKDVEPDTVVVGVPARRLMR